MKKLFSTMLIAFFCAGALLGQRVQKVVTIKNGNWNGIRNTLKEVAPGTDVLISSSDNEHLVLSGPKDAVAGFEEIIKQLDVPTVVKKDIETTVYMIVASMQAAAATTMAPELDPVLKQLKGIFNYKGFRLLDSFVLRSRDGEHGENNAFIPPLDSQASTLKISYFFAFTHASVDGGDNARVIRFDQMKLSMKIPDGNTYRDAGISTNVDVPEGKKVVIGKTSGVLGPDSALILVISAKVVD